MDVETGSSTAAATGAPDPVDLARAATPPTRRWAVFVTVVAAMLMHSIDQTSVATALSAMQSDLGTTLAWTSWTITIYALGQIIVLPLAGALGDRFGTRRVFLLGVGCFITASVACGLSADIGMLVAGRLVQGMAGAVLMPSATAIVAHEFGPERDRAVALFTTMFPIGAVLGPVVGGLIVTLWSWRGIFFINVPIGLVLLVVGRFVIRRSSRTSAGRIDAAGIAILTVLLLAIMVAITEVATLGSDGRALPILLVAVGVAAAGGFLLVRHLDAHPEPVIPPRLLSGNHLGVLNVMNLLFGAAVLGFSALVPHYAQVRYGVPPLAAGGLLTARAVLMVVASAAAVVVLRRLGHKPILLVGMVVMVVALVLTALPPAFGPPELWLAFSAGVLGAGLGFAAPAAGNAGLHLVPERAAAVSGLRVTFRQLGSILAVTTVTTVASGSADPGRATAISFAVLAAVMAVALLFAARIPNHRGRW